MTANRYVANEDRIDQRSIERPSIPITSGSHRASGLRRYMLVVGLLAAAACSSSDDGTANPAATADDTDNTVINAPRPEPRDTGGAVGSTAAPDTADAVDEAQRDVAAFFGAFNDHAIEDVMAFVSDDAIATSTFDGGLDPDNDPIDRDALELQLAWHQAQGEVWTEPTCALTEQQLPAGTTLSCEWETLDAPIQALGGDAIPTRSLIVVIDEEIVEFHRGYSSPDFTALGSPLARWLQTHYPDVAEDADCCEGSTIEESVRKGELRAEMAQTWAAFLDEYGCEPDTVACRMPFEDWVAEYESVCLTLDPPDTVTVDLVDHMRVFPRPDTQVSTAFQLINADEALAGTDLGNEQIAETAQERLNAMIELGIDERCHLANG